MNYEYAGLVKWDAFKAKYDNGTQYHSEIGKGSEGYPLKPTYYVTWLFTHSSKPKWQVVEVIQGPVSDKLVSALNNPLSGNMTIYALNDTGTSSNFSIGGLPLNKQFHFLVWNNNGNGKIKDNGVVQANEAGVVSINLELESFAVLTTMDVESIDSIRM